MDIAPACRAPTGAASSIGTAEPEESCLTDRAEEFERLIVPLEGRMIRSIWRVVRNREEVQDCLQDALTIIWKRLERIQRHPRPEALVLKICLNAAYDALRKRSRRIRQIQRPEEFHFPGASEPEFTSRLEQEALQAEIQQAIGGLPRKQALAVMMRIVQEQPYDVIAQALGCSEVTVRIHVSRGRARLSRRLAHLYQHRSKETPS